MHTDIKFRNFIYALCRYQSIDLRKKLPEHSCDMLSSSGRK